MKKESSTNLQKYSGIAEQMINMSLDYPEITKIILDIIYGDEGEGNGISTTNKIAKRLRILQISLRKHENQPGFTPRLFIELAEYFIFFNF